MDSFVVAEEHCPEKDNLYASGGWLKLEWREWWLMAGTVSRLPEQILHFDPSHLGHRRIFYFEILHLVWHKVKRGSWMGAGRHRLSYT